jgi:hypothetical protein
MTDDLLEQYRANVRAIHRGGLLDAEVDRLVDEQEQLVRRIRQAVAPRWVVELMVYPWIEIRD